MEATFAICRAGIMAAIIGLVRGNSTAADALLEAAEAAFRLGTSKRSQLLLRFFTESCSSVLALWPMLQTRPQLGLRPNQQALERFNNQCATVLLAGISAVPAPAGAAPSRVLLCLGLVARALMQSLSRSSHETGQAPKLSSLFPTNEQSQALLVLLLCREAAAYASPALIAEVLRAWSSSIFRDAARQLSSAGTGDPSGAAQAEAACWLLLSLASRSGQQQSNQVAQVARALELALGSDVLSNPTLASMIIAVLHDLGAAGKLRGATRERIAEVARTSGTGACPEVANYFNLVTQGLRGSATPAQRLNTQLCASQTSLKSAFWLHASSNVLAFEGIENSTPQKPKSISGPPLMVTCGLKTRWERQGCSDVVVRIDLYNVTGLSLKGVKVDMAISAHGKLGRAPTNPVWSALEGRTRPCHYDLEALHCRGTAVIWRDFSVRALRPLCITITISYENAAPEVSSAPDSSSPGGPGTSSNPDAWSEDEEDTNDRLEFACHPLAVPLSVYFSPFYGFDDPAGSVFPPPMVYTACPHAQTVPLNQAGAKLVQPPGFHRLTLPADCTRIVSSASACYAAAAFDAESVVCFLCHDGASETLEVRSSSQRLLQDLMSDIYFWILPASF